MGEVIYGVSFRCRDHAGDIVGLTALAASIMESITVPIIDTGDIVDTRGVTYDNLYAQPDE